MEEEKEIKHNVAILSWGLHIPKVIEDGETLRPQNVPPLGRIITIISIKMEAWSGCILN